MDFLYQPAISLGDNTTITWLQIILAIALVLFSWAVCFYSARLIGRRLQRKTKMDLNNIAIIQKVLFFTLLVVVTLIILSFLDIPLTAFAFISGAVAIGLGFGAKTIVENFLSGWILMSERPIRIGDYIELDNALGSVVSIGNRSTVIKRNDGVHITIPNSQILESKIINWSLIDPYVRSSVRVGVSYDSDVEKVSQLLLEVLSSHDLTQKEPAPTIVFEDFGDSALVFDAFFWINVKSGRELRVVRSQIRHHIYSIFKEHNIVIAYPQQDVHLYLKGKAQKPFQVDNEE